MSVTKAPKGFQACRVVCVSRVAGHLFITIDCREGLEKIETSAHNDFFG